MKPGPHRSGMLWKDERNVSHARVSKSLTTLTGGVYCCKMPEYEIESALRVLAE
jgi:hypothetical protein